MRKQPVREQRPVRDHGWKALDNVAKHACTEMGRTLLDSLYLEYTLDTSATYSSNPSVWKGSRENRERPPGEDEGRRRRIALYLKRLDYMLRRDGFLFVGTAQLVGLAAYQVYKLC